MKKKNILLLVLLLAVGFAAVSTTFVLNGTYNIGANNKDFDIYFSNAVENGNVKKSLIKDDTHIVFTADMSLVGEKYILDYDVTNGSKNYDAEVSLVVTESNEYVKITNEFDESTNILATESRSGKLTIEVIKAYSGTEEMPTKEMNVEVTINANAVEREELATGTPADKVKQSPWTITEDNDSNGKVSKGDLITLGTESFYVYDIEGDNVSAISQYNLYVGGQVNDSSYTVTPLENPTGLQDSRAIGYTISYPFVGVLQFHSSSNAYETSEIKPYVEAYAAKLAELDGEVQNVRLITKEELETLGCDSDNYTCESAPSYIYSTSYWTSSPDAERDYRVWGVRSSGHCDWNSVYAYGVLGVRPVIEISKSLF